MDRCPAKLGRPNDLESLNSTELARYTKEIPGIKNRSFADPEFDVIRPYLKGNPGGWYSISQPIPRGEFDPLYVALAKEMGGIISLAGGSDSIEIALLHTGKVASPGEINLVREKIHHDNVNVDELFKQVKLSATAWRGRPAFANLLIGVNGESGSNLATLVENAENGRYLIDENFSLNIPFKHGHAIVIHESGDARLYFRTKSDFIHYTKKELTLPDEQNYPASWHKAGLGKGFLKLTLFYSLIVYARARPLGWRYTEASARILKRWAEAIKAPDSKQDLDWVKTESFRRCDEQGVSSLQMREVFAEFGL